MSYMEEYDFWLKDDYFDKDTKKELEAILGYIVSFRTTRGRSRRGSTRSWSSAPEDCAALSAREPTG